jgi:DeoR/GlpR family transcriptional regulator of sugar metabolism
LITFDHWGVAVLPSQRDSIILNLLQQRQIVTVDEICTHCNCSSITARRDLNRLEGSGFVRRTHGGAVVVGPLHSPPQPAPGQGVREARLALLDRSDVLIVTPAEMAPTRLLVERARRAGVPIVAESIAYPGATTVVAIDDYRAGEELGHWAGAYAQEHLPGEVNVLDVSTELPNTVARSRGFAEGLRQVLPGARILVRAEGQGLYESARQITADALAVHPQINVIFGINDDSALGALDAYRAAGLDEERLVLVAFGLEGSRSLTLLEQGGPFKAAVAMFPEVVGRACMDAAVCAYHNCALPGRIITPHAIVTGDTLDRYYSRDPQGKSWTINWATVQGLPSGNPGFALLGNCGARVAPERIGWVQVFSSHDWYRNVRRSMQEYARVLGIQLEVLDASQDIPEGVEELKRMIGCTGARFVGDGDTIILDAGATTTYLARALRGRRDVTVITNSLPVLVELADMPGITLVAAGGVLRNESRALVGPGAEATFDDLRVDKAFIAGTGLSLDFGLSNTNIPEAGVKQAMLRAAREVILLADHTKIGAESLVKIAPLESIHRLITDAGISPHDRAALVQRGIEVTVAEVKGEER